MVLLLAILVAIFVLSPPWSVVVVAAGAILEVLELAGLRAWSRRIDRRTKPTTGAESMVGRTAEVVDPLRPRGTVRYAGELWEAEAADAGAAEGERVRIDRVDGLVLHVTPLR